MGLVKLIGFLKENYKVLTAAVILLGATLFLLSYFDPHLIFLNTTPTGGDTPAHNYLLRHLKATFFNRGEIISWAGGWWCGFPVYQFYFFFPYWVMALLSFVVPLNVAFKIIAITGVIFLPLAIYWSLKMMEFEEPVPLCGAIITLPFLFVETHTMWGVNIYSTLAGEIANSISFLFFVLFLGAFYRDMAKVKFRLSTVLLFTILFYTHFFTSVIAAGASVFFLFIFGRQEFWPRVKVFLQTNALTFLLIAWWLIPLLAKSGYSMEFGGDWSVTCWEKFPLYSLVFIPFILYGVVEGLWKKEKNTLFILFLLLLSVAAFYTGGKINASFTNVRFWPFIYFSYLILAAIGLGKTVRVFRAYELLIMVFFLVTVTAIALSANNIRNWVQWNFEGMEKKSDYSTFRALVLPLNNTPGRLANDLHEYNNHLGSTRVFEAVPALINKNILEGGIVNSATGSMFSYYIQGETSKNCAGFPTIVNPARFNLTNGTKHLKLANVKHFLAYWEETRAALLKHPEWKLLKRAGDYQLFELKSNDGQYVYIPKFRPLAVKTGHWKENAMEWVYTIKALDQPFILNYQNEKISSAETSKVLSEEEYLSYLASLSSNPGEIPVWLTLGPFYFPTGTPDEKAVAKDYLNLNEIKPAIGTRQNGKCWTPILRQGPVFVEGLYRPSHDFVNYNYSVIISNREQKALLRLSNDDYAKLYLNGQLVLESQTTGLDNCRTVEVFLKKGSNPIICKLEQGSGGAYFYIKLSAPDGKPLTGVQYSLSAQPFMTVVSEKETAGGAITYEKVDDQQIVFKTKALHQPHIIKVSYYPNWQVKGARRIYHVTPNFMLVYPEEERVTLYYGSLFVDWLGRGLTTLGVIIFLFYAFWSRRPAARKHEN